MIGCRNYLYQLLHATFPKSKPDNTQLLHPSMPHLASSTGARTRPNRQILSEGNSTSPGAIFDRSNEIIVNNNVEGWGMPARREAVILGEKGEVQWAGEGWGKQGDKFINGIETDFNFNCQKCCFQQLSIIIMEQEKLQDKIQKVKAQIEYFISVIKPTEWKKAISKAIKEYHLHNFSLEKVTPLRLKNIHSVIVSKFYAHENYKVGQWNENEFKTFIWLCFTYGNAIKKPAFSFERQEWICLSQCFIGKTPEFCEFQLKALEKKSVHVQRWTKEEDELLFKIIFNTKETNSSKIKWMEVSQQFYESSQKKFIRSAKVCREHWNTHLDPTILKCPWSFNEDLLLVKGALQFGKKWVKIVEILEHKRTEHDVKNRFFSLCGKYIKMKHLERSKEDIEADQLFEWLCFLEQEIAGMNDQSKKPMIGSERQSDSTQSTHPAPELLPMIPFLTRKTQEAPPQIFQMTAANSSSSPTVLFSSMPMGFGPFMFSPMNMLLRNQNAPAFNLFGFETLRSV